MNMNLIAAGQPVPSKISESNTVRFLHISPDLASSYTSKAKFAVMQYRLTEQRNAFFAPTLLHAESKSRSIEEAAYYATCLFQALHCIQISVRTNAVGYAELVRLIKEGREGISFIEGSYRDVLTKEFAPNVSDEDIFRFLFEWEGDSNDFHS